MQWRRSSEVVDVKVDKAAQQATGVVMVTASSKVSCEGYMFWCVSDAQKGDEHIMHILRQGEGGRELGENPLGGNSEQSRSAPEAHRLTLWTEEASSYADGATFEIPVLVSSFLRSPARSAGGGASERRGAQRRGARPPPRSGGSAL